MQKKYSWLNSKLTPSKIDGLGDGVFTNDFIKKDETLAIFGGHIISFKDEAQLPEDYRDTGIQISDSLVLSSLTDKEDVDNLNHSCDPNAGIRGQIFLVAMRDINPGEQITFDYAMCLSYLEENCPYFYNMKCLCGAKNCRKQITADDWKIPELQKKYNGFFQWYIQEKINNLNNVNSTQ